MEVTGQGKLSIPSTRAVLYVSIEFTEEASSTPTNTSIPSTLLHTFLLHTTNLTAITAQRVLHYLQVEVEVSEGVSVHTTAMTVVPVFVYHEGAQLQRGVRTSMSMRVKVNVTSAPAVLEGMLDRGVTRVDGVAFEAGQSEIEKGRKETIRRAVEDAGTQARVAAAEVESMQGIEEGATRGKGLQVLSLHVIGVTLPTPSPLLPQLGVFGRGVGMARVIAGASLPLAADDRSLTATVVMRARF